MQGWLKLHRKVTESPLFQDAHMFKLWVLCLTKAAFKPTAVMVDRQAVPLLPGQFVTGRKSLQADFNIGVKPNDVKSDSTLWRWLKKFEEWEMLNIETHNKYSVVTVVKWALYQGSDDEDEQQNEQQMNSKRTTDEQQVNNRCTADEQQMNTKKNVKNLRTEEGEEGKEKTDDPFSDSRVQKIYKAFGESFGSISNPVDVYKVFEYTDAGMHEDVVIAAFQAAAANRKKFAYALDLIHKASQAGVTDTQQFESFMAAYTEKQRAPHEVAAGNARPGSLQAKIEARRAERGEGNT